MIRRKFMEYGTVAFSLLMSGCGYVPEGKSVHVALHGHEGETPADDPLNPISVSDSEFGLHGELVAERSGLKKDQYRDVSIQLYSGDGQAICLHRIGDWSGELRIVSISTQTVPTYVILYSPDFWQEPMYVDYFVYDDKQDRFVQETASARDELPIKEIPTQIRRCSD